MLDHQHAAHLLDAAFAQWRRCLSELCSSSEHDRIASRRMLVATAELETRRAACDSLVMQALARGDDHQMDRWREQSAQLDRAQWLIRVLRSGGELDMAWRLSGVQLLT